MDQIQRTSVVPLPAYQTVEGGRDPLPITSPVLLNQQATDQAEAGLLAKSDAFKDYLDQTSTVLEDVSKKPRPDAADLLGQTSVYVAPGVAVGG